MTAIQRVNPNACEIWLGSKSRASHRRKTNGPDKQPDPKFGLLAYADFCFGEQKKGKEVKATIGEYNTYAHWGDPLDNPAPQEHEKKERRNEKSAILGAAYGPGQELTVATIRKMVKELKGRAIKPWTGEDGQKYYTFKVKGAPNAGDKQDSKSKPSKRSKGKTRRDN